MALLSVQVSGPVIAPSGLSPYAASIEFALRGAASVDTTVALPELVTVPVVDGAISTPLKGETNGLVYDVTYIALLGGTKKRVALGPIVLDQAGTFSLAALLPVPIPANARTDHTHKRGDTISWPVQFVDQYRRPVRLTGSTITSALEGPDGVTRALSVVVSDAANGLIIVGYTASQSAALPLGKHRWDARIRTGTVVKRTPTSAITIIDEVTP